LSLELGKQIGISILDAMIALRPQASQLYIFGFVVCWILAPSTTAEKLKCWSNMEIKTIAEKSTEKPPETQEDPERALTLMANAVEEDCAKGLICSEFDVTLKIKSKESYFSLKGCMNHNSHVGVCEAIKRSVLNGGDVEDGDVDCEIEAYYCITNFCNESKLGQTIGIVVGVILGVILLTVIAYLVYTKVIKKSNASANNYNINNNSSNVNNRRRHEKKRSSKSRSKSREYRRVPLPPATPMTTTTMTTTGDGIGNESLEEVTVNDQHQADD